MQKIQCLLLDIDGTLTDGRIYISSNGELFKSFHVKDGYAIKNMLPQEGITPIVVTARSSEIVQYRCNELGIRHCYQGVSDKLVFVRDTLLPSLKLTFDSVAYMGDDLPDLACMQECAIKACPADAAEEVRTICDFVSTQNGGQGASREFIEWLIKFNHQKT